MTGTRLYSERYSDCAFSMSPSAVGKGLINRLINSLPLELHLPSYNYCGPGTRLEERLQRGDRGVNSLDELCKTHDVEYHLHKDLQSRHIADQKLAQGAEAIYKSRDKSLGERSAAWLVAKVMGAKRKIGAGVRRKRRGGKATVSFTKLVKQARAAVRGSGVKEGNV